MTEEALQENIKDLIPESITGEMSEDILALKKEIAKKYIEELKEKKDMGVGKLLIGKGKSLEDYLVSENKGDQILDTIKGNIMDKLFGSVDKQSFVIGGVTYNSIFEYLKPVKEKLDNAKTEAELKILENEILTASTIVAPAVVANTIVPQENSIPQENTVEYNDATGRGKIASSMKALLQIDEQGNVPYVRGGEDIIKEGGLDCSGMVDYVLTQAGMDFTRSKFLKARNTTREYFKETEAHPVLKKGEVATKEEGIKLIKKEGRLKGLKKGDIVIRNSVSESYQPSRAMMDYNNKKYCLHHIAMIESVDEENGTIHTLESNSKEGVTNKNTRNVRDMLQKGDEFYVGKMNYDKLIDTNTMSV